MHAHARSAGRRPRRRAAGAHESRWRVFVRDGSERKILQIERRVDRDGGGTVAAELQRAQVVDRVAIVLGLASGRAEADLPVARRSQIEKLEALNDR